MSGGITQLVAVGAQDVHLVGDPQVSFFRTVYKRHTNFSHVVSRQVLQGNPSEGNISTVRFERKGDMLGYVYLSALSGSGSNKFPLAAIDKVEFLIGGQVVDTQYDDFIRGPAKEYLGSSVTKAASDMTGDTQFYPLSFWFCESAQSALPLVSLQYHDVELRITWGSGVNAATFRYECFADYIYLDTDEREMLANSPQDMLIYQVQRVPGVTEGVLDLTFNHPIKFLTATSNILDASYNTTETLKLQLNGVDVADPKTYTPHFNLVPRYYHCPYLGDQMNVGTGASDKFLIPFCLDTNKLQPTGSLNFSRLDSARLITNATGGFDLVPIYAVNYNVLRIQNGMGGLLYSN
jgi:hypothetical protein